MGVISRYFERLAAMVRPERASPAISADAAGLRIDGARVAWSDMRRLHVYKRDIYAGNLLCLAILAAEDRVFEINEESPGWSEAGDAIERFLPGSLPHAEWALRLMAAKPGDSLAIYPVQGTGSVGHSP
jgi:hypothetical protein